MTLNSASPRALPRLAGAAAVLVLVLLALSAYIRLRHAGLGCAEWPACYGQLPASAAPWWATAAHRVAAVLLGFLILAMAVAAWRRAAPRTVAITIALLALTLGLAALGFVTPAPTRPWITLLNIVGAMAMLALLVRLSPPSATAVSRLRPWAVAGVALLFAQIALGAWTSANFAAAACPALPDCGPAWSAAGRVAFDPTRTLPVMDGAVQPGAAAPYIHMVHRLGALAAFLCLGALALLAARHGTARRLAAALLGLLLLQAALGLAMVALHFPLWLAVAHNAAAALLLAAAVRLQHVLRRGPA